MPETNVHPSQEHPSQEHPSQEHPSQEHPSQAQLSAYNLGQLPPDEAVAIENHISECEPCCETIVGLSSDDTFVGLLKEARQLPTDQTVDHGVAVAPSSSEVPAQLAEHARYEVIELIGRGGMGDVYKARHRLMDRTVALKIIKPEFIRKREAVDRFHREVKAAARLSHPNIVRAYDAEQAGDVHFLVMEYVDGVDLSQVTKDQGALPIAEACDYIRQAAIGLQHAHEQGMVHRDIKPHNLMVMADGTVKILDFGLASLAPQAATDAEAVAARGDLTAAGAIMGTPDFISPEQAGDAHRADIRSDIYSLGATLYFLLSGRPPFAHGSVMHKLKSHAQVEPEPIENLREDVPHGLVAVITKMTAKDPNERYLTPREVADALESFLRTWQADEVASRAPELSNGGQMSGSDGQKVGTGEAGPDWLSVAAQWFFYLMWIPIALLLWDVFSTDEVSDAADIRFWLYIGAAFCLSTIAGALGAAQRFKEEMSQIERGDRRIFRLKAGETLLMVGILLAAVASVYKSYFSAGDGYSLVSGGAGSSGDGWYLTAGSTYLQQNEPGVLFGMCESPEGDRSISYVVLFRHQVNKHTDVSSASNTGLQFDGETASIRDGLTIAGKGIELYLKMRMERGEIKSSEFVVNGKTTDASQGRLFLVDLTSDGATWNQIEAKFPRALLAPRAVVGDTYLVSKIARQITEQLAKDNDQVRKFLEGATLEAPVVPGTRIETNQSSLTIKNDGTWKTHLGTESRSWDLHGNRLGEIIVRLLHIADGNLEVASEHQFDFAETPGETHGRVTLVAEGKQADQLSASLNVTFEGVAKDAIRTHSKPLIIPKGLLRSGMTINVDWNGQRLFPSETTFVHTMVMLPVGSDWGKISHRKDNTDSMVEASKKGAEFVVITLDWKDFKAEPARKDIERNQAAPAHAASPPHAKPRGQEVIPGAPALRQLLSVPTPPEGIDFQDADIRISDDQSLVLVGKKGEQLLSIDDKTGTAKALPVEGWRSMRFVPGQRLIVTKTWDEVVIRNPDRPLFDPPRTPHCMCEGDWIDPAISPDGKFLASRPKLDHVQFHQTEFLKPLGQPIAAGGNVSRMHFTSDSKHLSIHTEQGLSLWNPRTGERVAGPFRDGPYIHGVMGQLGYDSVQGRVVTVENFGHDADTEMGSRIVIRPLSMDQTGARTIEIPAHTTSVLWADANHLIVSGGRHKNPKELDGYRYGTYPMFLIRLNDKTAKPVELAKHIWYYPVITPDGKHVIGASNSETLCWKVGQTEPLWRTPGRWKVLQTTNDCVLLDGFDRAAQVRSVTTGEVLRKWDDILGTHLHGNRLWIFGEKSIEIWSVAAADLSPPPSSARR